MRKQIAKITAFLMLLSLFSYAGPGETMPTAKASELEAGEVKTYATKWGIVPKTSQAPVIDGTLNESIWQNAAVVDGFLTVYKNEVVENGPEYRIAYDDESLYISGVFTDEEAADLARIALIISPPGSGTTYHVATIPVDSTSLLTSTHWDVDWRPGSDWTRVNIGSFAHELEEDTAAGLYRLEAEIPFSAFHLAQPAASGDEWGLNIVHAYNYNTRPMVSWVPISTSMFSDGSMLPGGGTIGLSANVVDHGRFGSLFLSETPDGIQQTAASEDWTLEYVSFTEKRLTLTPPDTSPYQYDLSWKTPTGDWQPLSAVTQSTSGSRILLDFAHPEPLKDGLYQLNVAAYVSSPASGTHSILSFDRNDLIQAGLDLEGRSFPPDNGPIMVVSTPASTQVQQLLARIPDQLGIPHIGLPEKPELRPQFSLYTMSQDWNSIIANETGTAYPNPNYPETHSLSALNRKAETVVYPYYQDGEGRKYFFSAALWYQQWRQARMEAAALAPSDPLGAARLLYRFSEKSEGYVVRTNNEWNTYIVDSASGPPYNIRSGYLSIWWAEELNALNAYLTMFDEIKKTNAFDVLSSEVGEDVEEHVLNELILPSVEHVLSMPIEMHNIDPYIWQRLIHISKTFGMPDYIHLVVEWIDGFLKSQFLADGFWKEVSTAYHAQVMGNVSLALNALEGYSDPPGYVSPRSGQRFDDLDLREVYPYFGPAAQLPNMLTYPNGKLVPIQDTWANTSRAPQSDAGELLLPGAGIGRLTLGEGNTQSQLYTMFTPKNGHNQWDPLNLTLFAEGQELLPDLGYTYTKYRRFASSTMGHNTVVVNSRNMDNTAASSEGGDIEQFISEGGAFRAMRAAFPAAYEETETYSREPWFIPFAGGSGDKGYVLDLFRVSGGERHEYTLQGDANRDAFFRTNLSLEAYGPYLLPSGTMVQEPTGYTDFGYAEGHYPGYIYVRDVKQADLSGADQYQVTLVTLNSNGAEQAKMNITGLLESGSNELYLSRSPSVRSTRLNGSGAAYDNNIEADKYDMPKLVLRRDGTNLKSTFVTVMEPYSGSGHAWIELVERLQPDQAPDGAVAVQVTYGDTTDIVLSNPDHPDQPVMIGDITLYGEMGLVRLIDGKVRDLYLTGGTLLSKGAQSVTGAGAYTGTIIDTKRMSDGDAYNAIVTDAPVSADAEGRYMIITHPDGSTTGYLIDEVMQESGQTVLTLAQYEPGFELAGDGSSRQVYFPAKQWATGTHTFRIAGVALAEGLSPGTTASTGTLAVTVQGPGALPLEHAAVNLTGYSTLAGLTNSSGTIVLQHVPEGWHRVTTSKPGFARTVSEAVYVTAGQTANVQVVLPDATPPALSGVTSAVLAGDPIGAVSSKNGRVYLVPAGTLPVAEAIEAAVQTVNGVVYGTFATATAGNGVNLDTTGFAEGKYLVYAIDAFGNVSKSAGVVVIPDDLTLVDDSNPFVRYVGGWRELEGESYYGGTTQYANDKDHYVDIPFYGKQAIVLGHRNGSGGLADVYIDGQYMSTVNYYNASLQYQQQVYKTPLLPEGAHMLRMVLKGERSGGGSSTYTQARFDVLRVLGEEEIAPILSGVTSGAISAGTPISATSSKAGKLYLVPSSTESTKTAIEAAASSNGREATVAAHVYGILDTTGLATELYTVYAIDASGNVSDGSEPIAILGTGSSYIDSTNGVVEYTGNWVIASGSGFYQGSTRYASNLNEAVEIPFYGARAIVIGHRNQAGGLADVYVDDVFKTVVNYYNATQLLQQEIFDTGLLPEGLHTIKLVLKGERSGGSSPYTQGRFDALQVVGIEDVPPVLSQVTAGPIAAGASLSATSSKAGKLYLVPAATTATRTGIETAGETVNGRSVTVTANVYGTLDTSGLTEGLYTVYAIDASGNVSNSSAAITILEPEASRFEDNHILAIYSGTWNSFTHASYSGGTVKRAESSGAYVDIPFYGTSAKLIGSKSVNNGHARIYIDGVYQTTIDTYSSTVKYQQELYDTGLLSEGAHVLRVEAAWTKHGSANNYYVTLDAVQSYVAD